ncbi:group II intron reverse transcriptase/maturase [Gracilibacillus thailandensis]|uniref:Group II intron reverse transcriptase/maturase n=1 Tax=Gracilibacillus thailandensis TaxID=563735 RepID=A0A6N7R6K2_9BACI|nr:group II intron reverse transcriptase/maturase [Gracilibacillus thailandensis]MRI68794.1 group II intron reverse transcriptase/maturase [Gracilibacillus thailandensis]
MNVKELTNYTNKVKARELWKTLYLCAKASPTRRFHAIYDKIHRSDILWEAWQRVKRKRGSGGIDGQTIEEIIVKYGEKKFLEELQLELQQKQYHPQPVLRTYIPKENGKKRPLGIPTIKDRVAQMATKLVIEPIFEADFHDCSFGFRPKRNAHQAMSKIRKVSKKCTWVVDVDIQGYFDNINQDKLMKLVGQRISDRRVLKLIRKWLKAGVMEEGNIRDTITGTPQGGVISPLLANIYLNAMDKLWEEKFQHIGELVRYADDLVILCRTKKQALESIRVIQAIMDKLDLSVNKEKSRLVNLWNDTDGFDFLGFHNRKLPIRRKGGFTLYVMTHIPKHNAMKKMRAKIKAYTESRSKLHMDIRELIKGLNRRLQGFKNYYSISSKAKKWLRRIDWYVLERLNLFINKKRNRRKRHWYLIETKNAVDHLLVKLAS